MLTETAIRAARPQEKPYKRFDERGLYLLIQPNGKRLWRFKYVHAGREKLISLGEYPEVSLKKARDRRDAARKLVADGKDPSEQRRAEKAAQANTFKGIAEEWLALQAKKLSAETISLLRGRLQSFVYPFLGSKPITAITAPDLLAVLRRIEQRGAHETAHRTRSACGRVFRYAIATGRAERDPSADLRGALAPVKKTNFAAITEPAKVGELLRAIDGYVGQPATHAALKLAPLVFVRPGELRGAEWSEFDLDAAEWRIPAARMKAKREHLVPLSRQAVAILRDLQPLTGGGRYVFPGLIPSRALSNNTINAALRRIGFGSDQHTAHGFRTMASTLLNELGFPPDVIELQLAHQDRDETRATYNKAKRVAERRKMMQAWADYLDGLRAGQNIVPLHNRAA